MVIGGYETTFCDAKTSSFCTVNKGTYSCDATSSKSILTDSLKKDLNIVGLGIVSFSTV